LILASEQNNASTSSPVPGLLARKNGKMEEFIAVLDSFFRLLNIIEIDHAGERALN